MNHEAQSRSYQLILADHLEKQNGLVYLPTGSGKTFIALIILRRFSQQMKSLRSGGKRAIFMCNTVALAKQQYEFVRKTCSLQAGYYVGEVGLDNWNEDKWLQEIESHQVLIGTAQVFFDIISKKYLSLSEICLIIIDECHHATGHHPMHEIMRTFLLADQSKLPRVIGLTGVLLKGNIPIDKVENNLRQLEIVYRSKIVTISDRKELENVMTYSTKPVESYIYYSTDNDYESFNKEIAEIVEEMIAVIKLFDIGGPGKVLSKNLTSWRQPNKKTFIINALKDFIFQLNEYGIYLASIAIHCLRIELDIKKRQSETMPLKNIYKMVICLCEELRHKLLIKMGLQSKCNDYDGEKILQFSTNKLKLLFYHLNESFKGKKAEDICCLIFVERRCTAKCIFGAIGNYIKTIPTLKDVIKPQFVVGQTLGQESTEHDIEWKWDKKALEEFREGKYNMIVCSNVLEEGIDLPACNHVVVFDDLKTFNSYVQTKGRARSRNSEYFIFVDKDKRAKFLSNIQKYQKTFSSIQTFLNERTLQTFEYEKEAIEKHFKENIQPFFTLSGACLLPSAALSLLHRYCQTLGGSNSLSYVAPKFERIGNIVTLKLPNTSPLKETIVSEMFISTNTAKISAAFKACVKLYQIGEITDKLLPKTNIEFISEVADDHFKHWAQFNDNPYSSQTYKELSRTFDDKCPDELQDAMPIPGERCYLYEIKYTSAFEENEYNTHIYNGLKSTSTYGFLTKKRLPPLAQMPLFANQGQLNIQIHSEPIIIDSLNACDLKALQKFHVMIFRDLLDIWKPFFAFDQRQKSNTFLIVPIANGTIDRNLVQEFSSLPKCRSYSISERQNMKFLPEDFIGKIITKYYAESSHKRFVVTKIRNDLSSSSKMGNEDITFADFTKNKYGHEIIDIVHEHNFLLEVREITSRLNFIINAKNKARDVNRRRSEILLIPELCFNFKYPAAMYIKAMFLPSVLHRIYFMIHAEYLRCTINKYLGLDKLPQNSIDYKPVPLKIDESLRRIADDDGEPLRSDDLEDSKSLLHQLPTELSELNISKTALEDLGKPWKSYMEPIDISRNFLDIYTIDLGYYYQFMFSKNIKSDGRADAVSPHGSGTNSNVLSITDISKEERQYLGILHRSLSNDIIAAEQAEFLMAITTSKANDVFDMERFELLGDSFLKLASSLYLAHKYPTWNEGKLTTLKSKIVSNRNLMYCLLATDIPSRISCNMFNPKFAWLPPNACLPRNVLELHESDPDLFKCMSRESLSGIKLTDDETFETGICSAEQLRYFKELCKRNKNYHDLGYDYDNCDIQNYINSKTIRDKCIADTLEALLGVCVKNYGIQYGFRMLQFFGIITENIAKPINNLLDLEFEICNLVTTRSQEEVDDFLPNYTNLEAALGYKFKNRAYLLQAMTHPSYPTNHLTGCYQELEFIGDAILDFLISSYIYERQTKMAPGQLTDLRSALVNNITLACICVRHRIHLFLLYENSHLMTAINKFVDYQETQGHAVSDQTFILIEEDEQLQDGVATSTKADLNICTNVDVPKALGDIIEALIAAVYFDSRNLLVTWNVIYNLFKNELIRFSDNVPVNAVRQLYEHKYAKPIFDEPYKSGNKIFVKCSFTCLERTIEVSGVGINFKKAKLSAAKYALQKLAKYQGA